jgi:hypothetical protein
MGKDEDIKIWRGIDHSPRNQHPISTPLVTNPRNGQGARFHDLGVLRNDFRGENPKGVAKIAVSKL